MRGRILVVDDFPAVAAVAASMARMEGYEVRVAHSGRDALTAVADFGPDLVILDLMLGGEISGEDVLTHLRETGSRVPVLIVSALVVGGAVSFAGHTNVETMAKPFKIRDLSTRVAAIIAGSAASG